MSRRRFLELSGASLALAGLTACVKQPREGLVPYVKQPEEVVPGRPLFFATASTLSGYATGILVESHTGRPTKVEGNPDHPASLGATDLFAQASILSLYDPDRSQTITKLGQIRTWPAFADELQARVKTARAIFGEGFRLLTPTVTSPALAAKIRELLALLPKARWHQWEPAGRDLVRAGARLAFGQRRRDPLRLQQGRRRRLPRRGPLHLRARLSRLRPRVRAAQARGRDRVRRRLRATTRSRRRRRAPRRSPTTGSP